MRKLLLLSIGLLVSWSLFAQAELRHNEPIILAAGFHTSIGTENETVVEPSKKVARVQVISCRNNNFVLLFSNRLDHGGSLKIMNEKREPLDEFLDNLHVVDMHRIELNGSKMPNGKYIIAFESNFEEVYQEIEVK